MASEAYIFGEGKLKRKPICLVDSILDLSILEDACIADFKSNIYDLVVCYDDCSSVDLQSHLVVWNIIKGDQMLASKHNLIQESTKSNTNNESEFG